MKGAERLVAKTLLASAHALPRRCTEAAPPANMRLELSKSTEEAFDYAKTAAFIIVWPAKESWYLVDRLTGSLPFALSVGTPLITSSAFASVYAIGETRGAVVADDVEGLARELVGKDDAGAPRMTPARHQALIDATVAYREQVRAQNGRTLDALLGAVPGRTQVAPLALPNPLRRFFPA